MAAECLAQLVRERRRLTTDRVPLLLCDLAADDDCVVGAQADAALDDVRHGLAPARRAAPVPLDSLPVEREAAYPRVGEGIGVRIGAPGDVGVTRVRALVGDGTAITRGLVAAVTVALAAPTASARYVHLAVHRLPWWRCVSADAGVPGLTFLPPRTGRVAAPRVPRRHVKRLLLERVGAQAEVVVGPAHGAAPVGAA